MGSVTNRAVSDLTQSVAVLNPSDCKHCISVLLNSSDSGLLNFVIKQSAIGAVLLILRQ